MRWCPTWLQLADALTKENADAMDLLGGAISSGKYRLHAESQVLEETARQKKFRLELRTKTAVSQRKPESQVNFVQSIPESMVKVFARDINEEEIRALFEVVMNEVATCESDYARNLTQNKGMCSVKIPADFVNEKSFRGMMDKITFRYTRTTGMITIQGGAAFLDVAERTMKQVLEVYKKMIDKHEIHPLPSGAHKWGEVLHRLQVQGISSAYLEAMKLEDQATSVGMNLQYDVQPFIPTEPEYQAAVDELCYEGSRKLHHFPLWRQKYLQTMLQEFGANPDVVIELAGLTEQFQINSEDEHEWEKTEDVEEDSKSSKEKVKMPKAKVKTAAAKSWGYRGPSKKQLADGL